MNKLQINTQKRYGYFIEIMFKKFRCRMQLNFKEKSLLDCLYAGDYGIRDDCARCCIFGKIILKIQGSKLEIVTNNGIDGTAIDGE